MPIVWFVDKKNQRLMSAVSSQIFENVGGLKSYAKGLAKILFDKNESKVIRVNVFKIELKELIKNKKEYWTKIPREKKIRTGSVNGPAGWIVKFLKSPSLYDILVVVESEVAKKPVFAIGSTIFLKGGDNLKKVEEYMYFSDQVVKPESMHSAIYDVKKMSNLNLKTGKLYKGKIPKMDEDELMD